MAASGFLRKLAENNFEENNFVVEFFSEIILSICYSISKNNYFTGFSQFLSFFKHVRDVCRTQSSIKIEPIAKIVNGSRGVIKTKSNI